MKIYLDNCALQRPLDDKSNLKNRFETIVIFPTELIREVIK